MVNRLDDVVSGALEVLDSYGLEFCSMRRVASHLGVQPSALYHHVRDKQTLLALMADRIVDEVQVPRETSASTGPQASARALCRQLRAAMLSIRDGADVVATASAFRLGSSRVENELRDLLGGHAAAARTLLLFVFGHAQATQMQQLASSVSPKVPVDGATDETFEYGVDLILYGLSAELQR